MSDAPDKPAPAPAAPIDSASLQRLLRWVPFAMAGHLVVGIPALLISLVVAYGTFVQARATQRLQQAAAWPFLEYDTSNYAADGRRRINLTLTNNGVGPALLGPMEIRYRGQLIRTPQQFLSACCGFRIGQPIQLATTPPSNVALRPGETIAFFELPDVAANRRMIARLEAERWKLRVKSCYCSIFDECWTIEGAQAKPRPVAQCPTDWVAYRER